MITFFIGLAILIVGGFCYSKINEKIFRPSVQPTPAIAKNDGLDYVPMGKWRNSLVHLLNIAGTGPVLGPIQGILFGPIAFLTIPIGCVLGGALHDYWCGMISIRNGGIQMPEMVKKFLGTIVSKFYLVFMILLMLLVGVVFIYTPGDIFVGQVLQGDTSASNPMIWVVYGCIFAYYLLAICLPINKIIGKIYPVFGVVLLLSAVGIFLGMFFNGYQLTEVWEAGIIGVHPNDALRFIPVFFVTVACGIVSGFHSSQATIISRTTRTEKDGTTIFFGMMVTEGFIAMCWAAAAVGLYNMFPHMQSLDATSTVGAVSRDLLGNFGGIIAIIGVIILPISSGDTALRSIRLMLAENFKLDQKKLRNRLILSLGIFAVAFGVLLWAKLSSDGFNILWRYFAFANQTIAVFTFAIITVYMIRKSKPYLMALVPGAFYTFIVTSFILNAKIGFNLSWTISYIIAGILTAMFIVSIIWYGKRKKRLDGVLIDSTEEKELQECNVEQSNLEQPE